HSQSAWRPARFRRPPHAGLAGGRLLPPRTGRPPSPGRRMTAPIARAWRLSESDECHRFPIAACARNLGVALEWAININLRRVRMSDSSQIALIRKLYGA